MTRFLLSVILTLFVAVVNTGCTASQAEVNEVVPVAIVLTVNVESSERIYVGDLQVDLDGLVSALEQESSLSSLLLLVNYTDDLDSGTAFTVSRLLAESEVKGIHIQRGGEERTRWEFLPSVAPVPSVERVHNQSFNRMHRWQALLLSSVGASLP